MQVGGNVNALMQQVMAMRSPELLERMPEVEAMAWEDRVALVERGHHNISQLIRGWDKFADLLMAQGWTRTQVKQKAKGLKNARQKLEMGMRLADPKKIPKPFEAQAHAAFDVLAAWFLMDAGSLETILLGTRIGKGGVAALAAPPAPVAAPALPASDGDFAVEGGEAEEPIGEVGMVEAEMDGSSSVGGAPEEMVDRVREQYVD